MIIFIPKNDVVWIYNRFDANKCLLTYRVSLIEIKHKEYDPFVVLNIDREATVSEIRRAYRELSKEPHLDRGCDPEQFKEIAKAYKTLTNEEAKENWKKYGNPDGLGVTRFGIVLPKWLVDHHNSIFVLLIYTGVFMIVLPVIVLFRELPDVQENTKERPFQAPYSIKARTLLHAHLHQLNILSDNLGKVKNAPRLDTIENTMKLSPMLVQALLNTKSPLFQLPHITESHLRFF
ncbi:unnamed protein product [Rotaria sp. Silwood1]|nr:unnamed protein product [Rotaria sp. Silwood1]